MLCLVDGDKIRGVQFTGHCNGMDYHHELGTYLNL